MGALHAGHQSLIARARELSDEVVVSVFVNPLQFEDKDDLAKYPRTPELDGVHRPGHFDGVLTVVNRLFELVQPRYAIFGEKDFQQLFLITKMAEELHPEIEIVPAPTIREMSGLAMSSRNVRLGDDARTAAEIISRVLRSASEITNVADAREALSAIKTETRFTLDYAEIIDEETFAVAGDDSLKKRAIIAGWINGVRLIDNMAMKSALVRV